MARTTTYNGARVHWARFPGRFHLCAASVGGDWYGIGAGATASDAVRHAETVEFRAPRWWTEPGIMRVVIDRVTGEAVPAE